MKLTHTHLNRYWICMCSVTMLCPTICRPMDCSPPGSSAHEIFQARILEWVAISFFNGICIMKPKNGDNIYTYKEICKRLLITLWNGCLIVELWLSLVVQMVKNLPAIRETWFDSPGEGNGNPLQYFFLEYSMGRGAWWATVHGITKNWTWLTD